MSSTAKQHDASQKRSQEKSGMDETTRRELLQKLKKAAIVAPTATVLMLSANDAFAE